MTPSTEVRVDADLFLLVVEAVPNAMVMIDGANIVLLPKPFSLSDLSGAVKQALN